MAEAPPSRAAGLEAVLLAHRPTLLKFFTSRTRNPAEAEAILQEISGRLALATPGPIGDAFGHICRIGLNLAVSRARERQMRAKAVPILLERPIGDRGERIARALASMPADAARTFRLHRVEGSSHREVAEQLGIAREGVENHMTVAFRHLAKALTE